MLYYSITHSYFLYGLIVWGHTYPTYLEPLKKLQNKAIRILAGAKWDELSAPLYQNLKVLLSLSKLLKFETSKFIHKNLNNNMSNMFQDYYTLTENYHNRITRQSKNRKISIPLFNTKKTQFSIKYTGTKIWNAILEKIRGLNKRI